MKKILSFGIVSMFAIMTYAQTQTYIDLGLPSGTRWKDLNEYGFYSYERALSKFGWKLPTKEQMEELKNECNWTRINGGWLVVGPNHKSIILPTPGYVACDEDIIRREGQIGNYWSISSAGREDAWALRLMPGGIMVGYGPTCLCNCVRLVD